METLDPRQIEKFLGDPKAVRSLGPEAAQALSSRASKERGKTEWVSKGNIILSTGEFVSGEEFRKLTGDDKALLDKLGVVPFNASKEEAVVLGAILDGYMTYEELVQVTGLGLVRLKDIVKQLGYVNEIS